MSDLAKRGPKALLEYAYNLRHYGEKAPGGDETWREFDTANEIWLRSNDHAWEPDPRNKVAPVLGDRCGRCEVKARDHVG